MGPLDVSGCIDGSVLVATVDATMKRRLVYQANHGTCIPRISLCGPYPYVVSSCNYCTASSAEQALGDLRIPFTRIYAGMEDPQKLYSWSKYANKQAYVFSRIHISRRVAWFASAIETSHSKRFPARMQWVYPCDERLVSVDQSPIGAVHSNHGYQ